MPSLNSSGAKEGHKDQILINILKQKTTDEDVKRYAVSYMEKCGSFVYCKSILATLHEQARKLVDEVDAQGVDGGKEKVLEILKLLAVVD